MRVWNWPVLPVIPCVMTLVFLLTRMLIQVPRRSVRPQSSAHSPRRRDNLLGRLSHVVGADDREARLGEYLAAQLLVGTFHANDQRHFELDFACRRDDAGGDGVALHDAAENVDE